ncbi:MAG: ATP-binding cassette domain-containing protein [Gemmatimonadota bacterium]
MTTVAPPLLEADRVSKRFGAVNALENVSLTVASGEVTCLLGDNGAGKSTLVKILAGVHSPTGGELRVNGQSITFRSPREAREHGIGTVYQDLALIPLMPVWRNFFLGSEPTVGLGPLRRIDAQRCRAVAMDQLEQLGIAVRDPDQSVGTLSGGERQAVAIARALHMGAKVLLLDEPTAAMGVRQAGIVLEQVRRARDRGVGIVLITHNPRHAAPVGNRFIVLRHGRVVGDFSSQEASVEQLISVMTCS